MKKIVGFFGADSQVGTTMTALATAESLRNAGYKILFISGSGKLGGEFISGEGGSIDDIKAGVSSGRVTAEDLVQTIEEIKGLHIIRTVRNTYTAKYFPENTFQVMLEGLHDKYDYVIIDGGENANIGLMISALVVSSHRYFVTTQQRKSAERFAEFRNSVAEPLGIDGKVIINKYIRNPTFFMKSDISILSGENRSFTIPYIEYGWQSEMENRTMMQFPKFASAINKIRDDITGFERKEENGKRILFRRISG